MRLGLQEYRDRMEALTVSEQYRKLVTDVLELEDDVSRALSGNAMAGRRFRAGLMVIGWTVKALRDKSREIRPCKQSNRSPRFVVPPRTKTQLAALARGRAEKLRKHAEAREAKEGMKAGAATASERDTNTGERR